MTKQSSNGTWRHPATERKRNQLTQFLERWACFFIILNDTAVYQEVYFVTCFQALRKKSSQVFSPETGLCKFRMVCHVLKIKMSNCQIQTLRVCTFHIIFQIVFVKIMTKLIAWSRQSCQSLAPSMMMISNLEYRYTDILVKMILVPRRQSSQDWTITKRTMCFQRAASRWTFGTSREPVQSAPSPGAWTASAVSASTLWRSV